MQYLFSLDVENDIRNLIEGLPKFKSEKSEVSPNCEITKITDSSQMVIQLFIKGDSLSLAKYMDNLHTLLINAVDSSPTILINESSARFNKELYPLVNTFERKLRTMIYLKNVGNDDLIVDKLETLTFEKLYEILFTDKNFIGNMKKIVNDKTERMSSKSFYLSEIQNFNEHTKWDEIVKSANVDIVKDNFLAIIEYRNDVMHAHNISSKQYYEAKKMFTNCIVALEKEIKLLIESSEYCENSQEELLALLENLTNDHPVEVGEGLYLLTR